MQISGAGDEAKNLIKDKWASIFSFQLDKDLFNCGRLLDTLELWTIYTESKYTSKNHFFFSIESGHTWLESRKLNINSEVTYFGSLRRQFFISNRNKPVWISP